MDHELAKELKDAGFVANGQAWCEPLKEILPVPTLEELIEACGNEFGALKLQNQKWYAIRGTDLENSEPVGYDAPTPTEAVAHLWLALNKK